MFSNPASPPSGQDPHLESQAPVTTLSVGAANIASGQYAYLDDLLELEDCKGCNSIQWPTCPTPVVLSNWTHFLRSHPDQRFASYIQAGLSSGFHIGYSREGSTLRSARKNHPSASANPRVVSEHIRAEVEAGRLVGPLKESLLPLVHVNRLGSKVPPGRQVAHDCGFVIPMRLQCE